MSLAPLERLVTAQRCRDALDRLRELVVLPDHDERPSQGLQGGALGLVSLDIVREFGGPELGVAAGRSVVLGASVPEAPKDLDGDLGAGEREVDRHAGAGDHAGIDSIAQSEGVQGAA